MCIIKQKLDERALFLHYQTLLRDFQVLNERMFFVGTEGNNLTDCLCCFSSSAFEIHLTNSFLLADQSTAFIIG
jgi:hypothetical protein